MVRERALQDRAGGVEHSWDTRKKLFILVSMDIIAVKEYTINTHIIFNYLYIITKNCPFICLFFYRQIIADIGDEVHLRAQSYLTSLGSIIRSDHHTHYTQSETEIKEMSEE